MSIVRIQFTLQMAHLKLRKLDYYIDKESMAFCFWLMDVLDDWTEYNGVPVGAYYRTLFINKWESNVLKVIDGHQYLSLGQ